MLKKTIEDESILKEACEICGLNNHLKAVAIIPFEEMLLQYKETFKGYPLKINHWKKFYFRNQEITTLCVDCAYLQQLKRKNEPRAFSSLTKMAYKEFSLFKIKKKPKLSEKTKNIALIWLKVARERIGEDPYNYGDLYTIESEDENNLSAAVSVLEEPD